MDISSKIERKLDFGSKNHLVISNLLGKIDLFKGEWSHIEKSESRFIRELRQIATVSSIGSSTRIEGAILTDLEIEKLLKNIKISKLEKRDEQEVVGYYEALEVVLEQYPNLEISERYLHQLHGILLKHSTKDKSHKGQYKQLSNKVVANYPDGKQKVIFNTSEPHLTQFEIQDLLTWTNQSLTSEELHPLIIIAVFIYEFLSIHLYQDGNGRMSRLLTTLLLLRSDYNFIQYISFEHVVENSKDQYYKALMAGQRHRYTKDEKINEWLIYFLSSLVVLTEKLKEKVSKFSSIELILNDRQRKILNYVKDNKSTTIGLIESALNVESRNTLKKDLIFLVNENLILKTGKYRGVQYHFVDK